ncbi:uncharacterized protein PHACADRAFT_184423 [Phanerochaete carnosa HHB-10118-sp]|uniref:Uncharacterized protein n=1 Tax=Phanerochaete carnosa (strain HHB-10118-sp) TaxID=650164 RepID=K5W8V5_PHACS|nr:uncharacterized protein PHACADRAFT_184423 [Phanerochaete carnosa HHB-10118-sp]EKM55640.1 hypothetical protein PHACADRAFT_184423 [Phanerochaete carnosa HHB-10118-sp]
MESNCSSIGHALSTTKASLQYGSRPYQLTSSISFQLRPNRHRHQAEQTPHLLARHSSVPSGRGTLCISSGNRNDEVLTTDAYARREDSGYTSSSESLKALQATFVRAMDNWPDTPLDPSLSAYSTPRWSSGNGSGGYIDTSYNASPLIAASGIWSMVEQPTVDYQPEGDGSWVLDAARRVQEPEIFSSFDLADAKHAPKAPYTQTESGDHFTRLPPSDSAIDGAGVSLTQTLHNPATRTSSWPSGYNSTIRSSSPGHSVSWHLNEHSYAVGYQPDGQGLWPFNSARCIQEPEEPSSSDRRPVLVPLAFMERVPQEPYVQIKSSTVFTQLSPIDFTVDDAGIMLAQVLRDSTALPGEWKQPLDIKPNSIGQKIQLRLNVSVV